MSVPKWTAKDISKFLDIYKRHEILWNTNHEGNANKLKREKALNSLLQEVNNTGKNISMYDLKNKIKIIRTVYRKEQVKVERGRKSGINETYIPRLSWFKKADSFLNPFHRSMITDLDSLVVEESADENDCDTSNTEICDTKSVTKIFNKYTSYNDISANISSKRRKRNRESPIEYVIAQLDDVIDKSSVKQDNEFDNFARYIASLMHKLPPKTALTVQQQIHNILITELLKTVPSSDYPSYTSLESDI